MMTDHERKSYALAQEIIEGQRNTFDHSSPSQAENGQSSKIGYSKGFHVNIKKTRIRSQKKTKRHIELDNHSN